MWRKIVIVWGAVGVLFNHSLGQTNLIYNGSFEEYDSIPYVLAQIHFCKGWAPARKGVTPDYFHSYSRWYGYYCDTIHYIVSVPKNCMGFQYPKEGLAYVGIYAMEYAIYPPPYNNYTYSEPIYGLLVDSLRNEHIYEFACYYVLANAFSKAGNQLQVFFTDTVPYVNGLFNGYISSGFQVEHDTTIMMTDTFNWQAINGCLKAKGGERYIAIGNFRSRSLCKMIDVQGDPYFTLIYQTSKDRSYYYLDDLSLYDRGYYGKDAKAIPSTTRV